MPEEARMQWTTVSLNEASLDSPSFRAHANTFHGKMLKLNDWIKNNSRVIEKNYKETSKNLKLVNKSILPNILPPADLLDNGLVVNSNNTSSVVNSFNKDYQDFVKEILNALIIPENYYSDALKDLMTNAVEPYMKERQNFEYIQGKLEEYQIQSLTITSNDDTLQSNFLIDESQNVFEIRKKYIEASISLSGIIPHCQLLIDKFISVILSQINEQNKLPLLDPNKPMSITPKINDYLTDYVNWVNIINKFSNDMIEQFKETHKVVYTKVINFLSPSKDPEDYQLQQYGLLKSSGDCFLNKHQRVASWLYMKSFVGNDTERREIWIRRWCYIDDLFFGMFLLDGNRTAVEETDKFGIGLLELKYPLKGPRRFTFELKIKKGVDKDNDLVLTLQAENCFQLKRWIETIKRSRQKYLTLKDENDKNIAFAEKRYSPRFYEFASTAKSYIDQYLVTFDETTSFSLIDKLKKEIKPNEIDNMIEQRNFNFNKAITPINTQLTSVALLSGMFRNPTKYYDAIQANIWGCNTINQNGSVVIPPTEPNEKTTKSIELNREFQDLSKINDIQFRTVFESINYESNDNFLKTIDEPLLFKIKGIWAPNKYQKFPSTINFTKSNAYVYMSFMGFSHFSRFALTSYAVAECQSKNCIRMYLTSGVNFKFIVFFDNVKVMAAKAQYLIELAHDKTVDASNEDIIKKFKKLDEEYAKKNQTDNLLVKTDLCTQAEEDLKKTFWNVNSNSKRLIDRVKNIKKFYTKTYSREYKMSSKALSHIIFGDNSNVFPDCLFFADRDNNYNTNWYWKEEVDKNGKIILVRNIDFKLNRTDGFITDNNIKLSTTQRVVKLIENRYYEVDQDPLILKIPFCHNLKIAAKYIITSSVNLNNPIESDLYVSNDTSQLIVNYKLEFLGTKKLTFVETFVKNFVINNAEVECSMLRRAIHYYSEKIGKHAQTVRAIQLCGMLGVVVNEKLEEQRRLENEKTEDYSNDANDSLYSFDKSTKNALADTNANMEKKATYDVRYTATLLLKVLCKVFYLRIVDLFLSLFKIMTVAFNFSLNVWNQVNKLLLVGLSIAILTNIFLVGRSTKAYWSVRKADSIFNNLVMGTRKYPMERALYIKDLDLLRDYLSNGDNSHVMQKFNKNLGLTSNKYRESRKDIAIRRNDLLVELRVLQNMEKELLYGDYKNFLIKEIEKCRKTEVEYSTVWNKDSKLQEYCVNCSSELAKLTDQLL